MASLHYKHAYVTKNSKDCYKHNESGLNLKMLKTHFTAGLFLQHLSCRVLTNGFNASND